jgi:hypothetical protein
MRAPSQKTSDVELGPERAWFPWPCSEPTALFSGPRRPPPFVCLTAAPEAICLLARGESCNRRNWLASLLRGLCLFRTNHGVWRDPNLLTPCMPCSFGLLPHPRSGTGAQPDGPLEVTVSVRWIPLVTAAYGTRVARPVRTTVPRTWQRRLPARVSGEACLR